MRRAIDATRHPALFLVDTISSLASFDFRMDEWGVDLAVTGSQKGLMLPAGLGIVAASPTLWAVLDSAEGPQYHRREVTVRSEDGRDQAACIYWYIGPLDRGVPIPGGDYRAHAPATSIYHQSL